MADKIKDTVKQVLTEYLQKNGHRKTPERYAILDSIYSIKGHFNIETLLQYMEEKEKFRVSRATLYIIFGSYKDKIEISRNRFLLISIFMSKKTKNTMSSLWLFRDNKMEGFATVISIIRIIQLFMSLSILVLIHEFGHFIFSKLFKVRVEKFCLFFDPWFTLFKFKPKKSNTEYCVGWLPLGGYVKISGMIDESMDTEQMKQPEQPWEFRSKPAWQRLLIMIGGVLFNFILAIIIYGMILFTWGESTLTPKNPELGLDFSQTALNAGFQNGDILIDADGKSLEEDAQSIMIPRRNGIYSNVDLLRTVANARVIKVKRNGQDAYVHLTEEMGQNMIMDSVYFANYRFPYIVDSVIDGGAKVAGLMKGDRIIAVDGNETPAFSDFERYITSLKDAGQKVDSLQIKYIRNNETNTVSVAMSDDMKMGILYKSEFQFMEKSKKEYSFFASIPAGVTLGVNTMKGYVSDMKYVFTKKGANSLGGFGSIAKIFPKLWDWQRFWEMTALLSIMLAVMNILPIPALDGGHVLFLFYEIITGRKPNDKFLEYAQVAGMILLFGLLIWANLNDIIRFLF